MRHHRKKGAWLEVSPPRSTDTSPSLPLAPALAARLARASDGAAASEEGAATTSTRSKVAKGGVSKPTTPTSKRTGTLSNKVSFLELLRWPIQGRQRGGEYLYLYLYVL